MKKNFYNTNDTIERKAQRHIKHQIKESKESMKYFDDEVEYNADDFTYDDYKKWLMNE